MVTYLLLKCVFSLSLSLSVETHESQIEAAKYIYTYICIYIAAKVCYSLFTCLFVQVTASESYTGDEILI